MQVIEVALLLDGVHIRDQRDLLEERRQLGLLRQIRIVGRHVAQLDHVVPAVAALLLAMLAQQRLLKVDPRKQQLHQLAQAALGARGDQLVHDPQEREQRLLGAGVEGSGGRRRLEIGDRRLETKQRAILISLS